MFITFKFGPGPEPKPHFTLTVVHNSDRKQLICVDDLCLLPVWQRNEIICVARHNQVASALDCSLEATLHD